MLSRKFIWIFYDFFYLQCKSMMEYILVCPLEWIQVLRKESQFLSRVTAKWRECRQIWKWCWTPVFIAYIYIQRRQDKNTIAHMVFFYIKGNIVFFFVPVQWIYTNIFIKCFSRITKIINNLVYFVMNFNENSNNL